MTVTPQELADTLRRRYRRELEEAEERREGLLAGIRSFFREKERALPGRCWVIGSLTEEYWGRGSDVDLVVEGMSHQETIDLWRALSARLDARVDLLRFEELSDSFRRRVEEEGLRVDEP